MKLKKSQVVATYFLLILRDIVVILYKTFVIKALNKFAVFFVQNYETKFSNKIYFSSMSKNASSKLYDILCTQMYKRLLNFDKLFIHKNY